MKKEKKYFSFVGDVWCTPISSPCKTSGEILHSIDLCNGNGINIWQSADCTSLVLVEEYFYHEEREWSNGDFDEAFTETKYYLAFKKNFECNPAVPVSMFASNLEEVLS